MSDAAFALAAGTARLSTNANDINNANIFLISESSFLFAPSPGNIAHAFFISSRIISSEYHKRRSIKVTKGSTTPHNTSNRENMKILTPKREQSLTHRTKAISIIKLVINNLKPWTVKAQEIYFTECFLRG
ncbi:hypothetical protein [Paenibacillus sp. Y412MC10]|uniref:hypothetical protein n=1 Tax=Geobacillus sp. (strain Y412MC10) TaxID=481743 RepID=UPI001C92EC75|nr:hypothetical protein [Paenibacillus sp. Y412MC10]